MISLPPTPDRSRLLAMLCRRSDLRTNPPEIVIPHNWRPLTVTDPVSLSLFTDAGAWDFIAGCFEAGVGCNHKPPSALYDDNAYEMLAVPQNGDREIYMKVALRPNVKKLIGVSFHYARHP